MLTNLHRASLTVGAGDAAVVKKDGCSSITSHRMMKTDLSPTLTILVMGWFALPVWYTAKNTKKRNRFLNSFVDVSADQRGHRK